MVAKIFNPEALSEIIEIENHGSKGLVKELVDDFNQLSHTLLKDAIRSAAIKDFIVLERSTHSLKSSSALLGLEQLAAVCFKIEEAAAHGAVDLVNLKEAETLLKSALTELNKFADSRYLEST